MKLNVIKNEIEYQAYLQKVEDIWDSEKGTENGDLLEVLSILIEKYEDEHYPIQKPNPIEAIKFRMEQTSMNQTGLGNILGGRSRASEILNYKRHLSLQMIRELNKKLNIPSEVLITNYKLQKSKSNKSNDKKMLAKTG
jgi:HTH-type transcriptional regulator/antitoxin HigA